MKLEDVHWVVNDLGELGVRINDQFFFLYKGESYVGGEKWRAVAKREFGEVCYPKPDWLMHQGHSDVPMSYYTSVGDGWKWISRPEEPQMNNYLVVIKKENGSTLEVQSKRLNLQDVVEEVSLLMARGHIDQGEIISIRKL